MVVDSDRSTRAELVGGPRVAFTCTCGLELRQRQSGGCHFILPDGEVCAAIRGSAGTQHYPERWHAGFDHVDPSADAPCNCRHPRHDGVCEACHDHPDLWTASNHPYLAGIIKVDHFAEEDTMARNCLPVTAELNRLLKDPVVIDKLGDVHPIMATQILIDEMDDEISEVAEREIETLPGTFMPMLLANWHLAMDASQPFELISEPPPKPLEFARAGMVSTRFEHDDDGVRMFIAHVHGYHAAWIANPTDTAN